MAADNDVFLGMLAKLKSELEEMKQSPDTTYDSLYIKHKQIADIEGNLGE